MNRRRGLRTPRSGIPVERRREQQSQQGNFSPYPSSILRGENLNKE
jgi:hypothetical protein